MKYPTLFCTLIAFLILFLSHQTFAQNNITIKQNLNSIYNPPVFEEITIADGLPENSGTCILQDYLGYLWIGTQNGLVRYDGYSMKVFLPEIDNDKSISDGKIVTIYEDKNKTLWVGTMSGGLCRFDRTNESFKTFKYNSNDSASINNNHIHCIYEDQSGRFWIGTWEGLNLLDRKNEIFTRYYFNDEHIEPNEPAERPDYNLCVNAIIEDAISKELLIGTELYGVWKFNVKEKVFSKYDNTTDIYSDKKLGCIQSFYKGRNGKIWAASTHTLSSIDPRNKKCKTYIDFAILDDKEYRPLELVIGSVIEDKDGFIWSGFWYGEKGVFQLNPETGEFFHYNLFPDKPNMISYNQIYTVYEDRSGIIWIGTWLSGIKKLDKRKNQFRILSSDPNLTSYSLSHSFVYSGIYDPGGYIWYCTQRALDKYDIKKGTYKHYLFDEKCITNSVYVSVQDKTGYIWLGTARCGLIRFDPSNESYRFYLNNPNAPVNLVNKQILYLYQDTEGILWIGTDGSGLYKYDITNNKVIQYENNPNDTLSLSQNQVKLIFEDRFDNLWIGTNLGGLNRFDRKTAKFYRSGFDCVIYYCEDKQGNLWITDYWTGLNLFDRESGVVTANYGQKNGSAHQQLAAILEDDHNNLWITTKIGLSKFNTQTRTFQNYGKEDGLPEWFTGASLCFKDAEGKMYFNTNAGQIVFHPDSIEDNPTPPQIILTGLSLFNNPDKTLDYQGFISELKELTVPYDQNDLRFDFVGLHFSAPERNKYKYFLENFDKNWVEAGYQRNATYTNLDPGEYVFRVTASNKDGVWNEAGASIKIIITPPWWKTGWAYLFYILFIGILIYFTLKVQIRRIRIKNEYEISKFEAQKLHEVDELKSRFFANISHEFRTPLTLIQGPAQQIIENSDNQKITDSANLIHRSAVKLNRLVNQLLDLSKLEAGEATIRATKTNVVAFIKEIVLSFTPLADKKKITLELNNKEEEILAYLDRDKFYIIINNILSNAFKFTAEYGKINVGIDSNNSMVEIKISDTGIGIPAEKINKIFDRFYQVDGSHTRDQEGTGIGLALTKELVDLHKGKINVQSKEGEGSTFTISIPLGKDHFKPEQISEIGEAEHHIPSFEDDYIPVYASLQNKFDTDSLLQQQKSALLLVEDNSDVRLFIKGIFKNEYEIYEASNGEEGLKIAFEEIPDLVISDLMMPKMDGIEMCDKIKSDERTSHIPIIMLTAKATDKEKIEGYETGADDYITKPFDSEVLRARVKNILEQRKKLKEHFARDGLFNLEDKKITLVDKAFLQKAVQIVNNHISDTSFGVDIFASEIALSRKTLHKKLVSLIGEPPSELIKRIRLSKAAKLLQVKHGNISEISLDVGFNNPAYFSDCFRKQFGISPSQFQQKFTNY